MTEDEFEEAMGEDSEKLAGESLRPTVAQMRGALAEMADESVLSEEGIAFKRMLETLVVQMETTIFTTEFFVDDMVPDMRMGWEAVLAQALHLAEISPEDQQAQVFVNLSRTMLQTIDEWQNGPGWTLKDDVPTPEARKMLTQCRSLVSKLDSVLHIIEILPKMSGGERYLNYTERQVMEWKAQQNHLLQVEGAIVTALEKRGEKVPKWRRKK